MVLPLPEPAGSGFGIFQCATRPAVEGIGDPKFDDLISAGMQGVPMSRERARHPDTVVSSPSATEDRTQSLSRQERQLQQALSQIADALRGLRFGQATASVQDGVVVP